MKKRYGKISAEQKCHHLLLNVGLSGGNNLIFIKLTYLLESSPHSKLRLSWIKISVGDPRENLWFISLCQSKQQLLAQHTKLFPLDFRPCWLSLRAQNPWGVQGTPDPIQPLLGDRDSPSREQNQPCSLLAPDLCFLPTGRALPHHFGSLYNFRTNSSPTQTFLCCFPTDTLNNLSFTHDLNFY